MQRASSACAPGVPSGQHAAARPGAGRLRAAARPRARTVRRTRPGPLAGCRRAAAAQRWSGPRAARAPLCQRGGLCRTRRHRAGRCHDPAAPDPRGDRRPAQDPQHGGSRWRTVRRRGVPRPAALGPGAHRHRDRCGPAASAGRPARGAARGGRHRPPGGRQHQWHHPWHLRPARMAATSSGAPRTRVEAAGDRATGAGRSRHRPSHPPAAAARRRGAPVPPGGGAGRAPGGCRAPAAAGAGA